MEFTETKTISLNWDVTEKYATHPVIQQIIDVISVNAKSTNEMNKIFGKTLDDIINANKKILIRLEHLEDEFKEINARLIHVEEYLQETTKSEKSEEEVKDDFVKIVIKK